MKWLSTIFLSLVLIQGPFASAWVILSTPGGGGGGNTPAFLEQISANAGPTGSAGTTAFTLSAAVTANNEVVGVIIWSGGGQSVDFVDDTSGTNTYTLGTPQAATISGVPVTVQMFRGRAATALSISHVVTVHWSGATFGYRFGRVFEVGDTQASGQPDAAENATGTSTSPSAANNTSATKTAAVGIVLCGSATYSAGSWTNIGSADFIDFSFRCNYVQRDFSSSGSINPAGTISASQAWIVVWMAIK